MRIIKQLVSFVLGVAVGICLYSLLKLRPLSPALVSEVASPVVRNPRNSLRPTWVQPSAPRKALAWSRVHSPQRGAAKQAEVTRVRPRTERIPQAAKLPQPPAANVVQAAVVPPAPPPPTIFKTIGYVEKAGGQVEAIILQDKQVQVVHMGDLIAGRYRVTKVNPDSVAAIDETQGQFPMTEPANAKSSVLTASATEPSAAEFGIRNSESPAKTHSPSSAQDSRAEFGIRNSESTAEANDHSSAQEPVPASTAPSAVAQAHPATAPVVARAGQSVKPQLPEAKEDSLGFVEKANGIIESVMADGNSVRLVRQAPAMTLAQLAAPSDLPAAAPSLTGRVTVSADRMPATSDVAWPSWPSSSTGGRPVPLRLVSYETPANATRSAEKWAATGIFRPSADFSAETIDGGNEAMASGLGLNPLGSARHASKLLELFKPLGFIVKANGEFDAILSVGDEVDVVRQGDFFADRYRAVSVSTDAVEAVEELPPRGPGFQPVNEGGQGGHATAAASGTGFQPVNEHGQDGHGTFVFLTLGYVQTQEGDLQAVVAVGSEVYLVKQGETFAGGYCATSVDPLLVLAVKVAPGQPTGDFLSAQTKSGSNLASNDRYWDFPLFEWASAQGSQQVGASGSPSLTDLGMNLPNSSLSGTFFTADHPHVGYR